MSKFKKEFDLQIRNSILSPADKFLWTKLVSNLDDQQLNNLILVIKKKPYQLLILNRILKYKIDLLQKGDEKAWDRLLNAEESILKKLEKEK